MQWTEYRELAQSTGFIMIFVISVWCLMAGIIYWAFVSGSTSMQEKVKFRWVEDDKPINQQ